MMKRQSFVNLVAAAAVAGVITVTPWAVGTLGAAGSGPGAADTGTTGNGTAGRPGIGHWVHSWVSMPQLTEPGNLPPAPFGQDGLMFADTTLRQTVHTSVGGRQIRLRFSNAFGGVALPITKVAVALPLDGKAGVSAVKPGTSVPVTFHGNASVVIPVGAQIVSDPLTFPVAAQSNLTVTAYLRAGQASNNITSHPGSRTSSYLLAGDHVADPDLPGAASVAHWYFLSGLEIWSRPGTAAAAMLGDSLTDGRGSTTNGNDRWPDQLLAGLQAQPGGGDVAVLNQAAGGNRVLNDGLGPNGLARLDRDILSTSGVNWMIVFEGINDIGTAEATDTAQKQVTADLIAAYDQIVVRAHAQGIRVYGATLTPMGGNTGYDDATGYREASRQAVNTWIRTGHVFDAVLDFDTASRDPQAPRNILPDYDTGDHLHLNPAGYRALAGTVPARLFRTEPLALTGILP